jgi:hypothetical protein
MGWSESAAPVEVWRSRPAPSGRFRSGSAHPRRCGGARPVPPCWARGTWAGASRRTRGAESSAPEGTFDSRSQEFDTRWATSATTQDDPEGPPKSGSFSLWLLACRCPRSNRTPLSEESDSRSEPRTLPVRTIDCRSRRLPRDCRWCRTDDHDPFRSRDLMASTMVGCVRATTETEVTHPGRPDTEPR